MRLQDRVAVVTGGGVHDTNVVRVVKPRDHQGLGLDSLTVIVTGREERAPVPRGFPSTSTSTTSPAVVAGPAGAGRSSSRVPGGPVPSLRQIQLSLCPARGPRPRAQLLLDPPGGKPDRDPDHSRRARSRTHAGADRRVSPVAEPDQGVGGGQRADLSGAVGRLCGPDGPKKGLQKTLAQEIQHEVRTLMGPAAAEALDFEALETALRRRVLEGAARTVETQLNQDHSDATPHRDCCCGGTARYVGRRTKQFITVLGPMRL